MAKQFKDLTTKKDRMDYIRRAVAADAKWALNALVVIYGRQTADEQACQDTRVDNKMGFTGADAFILSSFAEQYGARGSLSPKQMKILHQRMPKYAKQLLIVSEAKAEG